MEQQLWNIANTLRGKMDADEFRDYILGFIFCKYLSERMHLYADEILKEDNITYLDIKENTKDGKEYLEAVKEQSLIKLDYFLKPSELFSEIAKRGNGRDAMLRVSKEHSCRDAMLRVSTNKYEQQQ